MSKNLFDLTDESGGVLIVATDGGFEAFAQTKVEHVNNSHVLLLVRGIMEILQTNPLILYEAGQESLQKELLEHGIDINQPQAIAEEALQAKDSFDYANVVDISTLKPKGNA